MDNNTEIITVTSYVSSSFSSLKQTNKDIRGDLKIFNRLSLFDDS